MSSNSTKGTFQELKEDHPIFQSLAQRPEWWDNILSDPDLYVEVRKDNYINVYYYGGNVACIKNSRNGVQASAHQKYLGDCTPVKQNVDKKTGHLKDVFEYRDCISELGDKSKLDAIKERVKTTYLKDGEQESIRQKRKVFTGSEKLIQGQLIKSNPDFIDSEFAYEFPKGSGKTIRIDLVELRNGILTFVELKRIDDDRLNTAGVSEPEIVRQMNDYRNFIQEHKDELLEYYTKLISIKKSIGLPVPDNAVTGINPEPELLVMNTYTKDTPDRIKRITQIKETCAKNGISLYGGDFMDYSSLWLAIKIYRPNQIGGQITRIEFGKESIIIDLGHNLPGTCDKDVLANEKAVADITKVTSAILYTHYHGDHLGLFDLVPVAIPQYIGEGAKKVTETKYERLTHIKEDKEAVKAYRNALAAVGRMKTFRDEEPLIFGAFKVTPYKVSHSAYDAYMFLIEVGVKRILHTGDLRGHGYLSSHLFETIDKIGQVDVLIIEGTMLGRKGEKIMTEAELSREAKAIMEEKKYVFVQCSSTDAERLVSFKDATRSFGDRNRQLVADSYQKAVFDNFHDHEIAMGNPKADVYDFGEVFEFNRRVPYSAKAIAHLKRHGFTMFIRASETHMEWMKALLPNLDSKDVCLIYSQWRGYLKEGSNTFIQSYANLLKLFPQNVKYLHTSGHADIPTLRTVCEKAHPTTAIIPVHHEDNSDFASILNDELKSMVRTNSFIENGICFMIK